MATLIHRDPAPYYHNGEYIFERSEDDTVVHEIDFSEAFPNASSLNATEKDKSGVDVSHEFTELILNLTITSGVGYVVYDITDGVNTKEYIFRWRRKTPPSGSRYDAWSV